MSKLCEWYAINTIILTDFIKDKIRNDDDSNKYAYKNNVSFYAGQHADPNIYINPRLLCRLLNMPFSIIYLKPVCVLHWVWK